jgi:hypothetical protein
VIRVVTQRSGRPVVGYRYGTRGKVYTGPGAQAKAALQGSAIHAAGYASKIARDNK